MTVVAVVADGAVVAASSNRCSSGPVPESPIAVDDHSSSVPPLVPVVYYVWKWGHEGAHLVLAAALLDSRSPRMPRHIHRVAPPPLRRRSKERMLLSGVWDSFADTSLVNVRATLSGLLKVCSSGRIKMAAGYRLLDLVSVLGLYNSLCYYCCLALILSSSCMGASKVERCVICSLDLTSVRCEV